MDIEDIFLKHSPALALAPMAGYANFAFRQLISQMGADITYSELASASALARQYGKKQKSNIKTDSIIKTPKRGVHSIQLFGSNPQDIEGAVNYIGEKIKCGECDAKFIDLNLGCPAQKVMKNGAGSALLLSPKKISQVAAAAVKSSLLPISAKLRLLPKIEGSISIARLLEGEGLSMLAVHGRTAKQRFGGNSSWEAIGKIKEAVSIPVLGNGDVKTPQDAKKLVEISGCDGVMIGRAALSNPCIFIQTKTYFEKGAFAEYGQKENSIFFEKYVSLSKKHSIPFIYSKELAIQLAKGFRGASALRAKISKCKSSSELERLMFFGEAQ